MECLKCNQDRFIKSGSNVKGRQRYECKNCGTTIRPKLNEVVNNDKKKQAMQLYLEGISPQRISVLANKEVSHETVRKWVGKFDESIQPISEIATRNNIRDFRKTQREELPPFENIDNLLAELQNLLNKNKSKIQSGVLVIGLDITKPFSCLLISENPKSQKK
jgi:transposase-like protein